MFSLAFGLLGRFKKFLPFLLIALVVGAGVYLVKDWKKSIQEESFKSGQSAEHDRQEQAAREIEKALVPKLNGINERIGDALAEQKEKEIVYVDRIVKEIESNPVYNDCRISDGMLNDRNEIRQSLDAPADSGTGEGTGGEGDPAA